MIEMIDRLSAMLHQWDTRLFSVMLWPIWLRRVFILLFPISLPLYAVTWIIAQLVFIVIWFSICPIAALIVGTKMLWTRKHRSEASPETSNVS